MIESRGADAVQTVLSVAVSEYRSVSIRMEKEAHAEAVALKPNLEKWLEASKWASSSDG